MPSEEEYEAFLKALGARIRALRKERGLTMRDIVIRHGYHDAQWRKYEGGGSLNVKTLLRIAEILEQPIRSLFPEGVHLSASPKKPKASTKSTAKKSIAKRTTTRGGIVPTASKGGGRAERSGSLHKP